jgi:dihydropteroate synthase
VLDHIGLLHGLGCAVAVGASRKSFIAGLSGGAPVNQRRGGSLAAALYAAAQGVQIVRVHDVAETRQALAVAGRIAACRG